MAEVREALKMVEEHNHIVAGGTGRLVINKTVSYTGRAALKIPYWSIRWVINICICRLPFSARNYLPFAQHPQHPGPWA